MTMARELNDNERILLLEGAVARLQQESQDREVWESKIQSLVDQLGGAVRVLKFLSVSLIAVAVPMAAAMVEVVWGK